MFRFVKVPLLKNVNSAHSVSNYPFGIFRPVRVRGRVETKEKIQFSSDSFLTLPDVGAIVAGADGDCFRERVPNIPKF